MGAPDCSPARAARVYGDGTARSRAPSETLELLLPHLARFGITRLSNVTGLDRIGIPVYQAVRPNARSLSVSQGKGVDDTAAKVSALMESLECHHAEHSTLPVRIESHRALARRERVANPWRLPLSRLSAFDPERQLPWVAGRDVRTSEPTFVPYELVHANATVPRAPGSGCFVFSTNGLSSGNNRVEAVLHGICELIERDAEALARGWSLEQKRQRRVELQSIDDPLALELLRRYGDAGIEVIVWDVTSDVGVAVFRVVIFDPESDPELNPYPAAYGAGCHPERSIALCRALTEAAQSRLTAISGARDDLTTEEGARLAAPALIDHHRRLAAEPGARPFAAAPNTVGASLDDELAIVLERLSRAGMSDVIAVDLSTPELDFAFTRTVIPGLEGPIASPSYRPGARAQRGRT